MTAQPHTALQPSQDLAFLPRDIFWLIAGNLAPRDLVRCRRVSRPWREAFSNPAILVPLMKKHFPWTQEVNDLRARSTEIQDQHIRDLFDQVTARYYYLERGKPRSIQRHRLCDDFGSAGDREWFQVQPWESHASHVREFVDRQFAEALWTHEKGLLVYPSADHQCLVLMDMSSDRQFMVPLVIRGKVIRRVRLQRRLLIVEWAEPKAFHWLNDSDGVHRHFASSFDVTPNSDAGWTISPRNEWKIMFLGHPLSERDRFFSAHSDTYYVIYIWQPNRSLYTADEDAPIESLFVWDISRPSSYRPSLDPMGRQTGPDVDESPSIVARFGFRDLEFFGIRQRGCPSIQRLEITEDGQAVVITENLNTWLTTSDPLGLPMAIKTSIPLQGHGPHWREESNLILSPYRSNCSLHTSPLSAMALFVECWYGIIAQVTDPKAGLSFCLHFDPVQWAENGRDSEHKQSIKFSIQTMDTKTTNDNLDFTGRGKIDGCENYVVGENRNRELVIYRFDR